MQAMPRYVELRHIHQIQLLPALRAPPSARRPSLTPRRREAVTTPGISAQYVTTPIRGAVCRMTDP